MLEMYLSILDALIEKGEVKKGDAIIDETKGRLIDYICELSPSTPFEKGHIAAYIEKVFEDRYNN
ncbi:MAG: hypothetical protein IIX13_05460 [Bacteroidales bacterium]|nr:hypothetical protein [Bacteroidales bacterium]